jgi:hypothetical protein
VVFLEKLGDFGCCLGGLWFVLDNAGVIDSQMDFAWGCHGVVCPACGGAPITEA